MAYRTVSGARKRVPSLKNMTDKQVRAFIAVFNSLIKKGTKEQDAFPQAIGTASKIHKSMDIKIEKSTLNDKLSQLSSAVREFAKEEEYCGCEWPYMIDADDEYVYIMDDGETTRYAYTYQDGVPEIDPSTEQQVIRETVYTPVGPVGEDDTVEKSQGNDEVPSWFSTFINKHFGGSKLDSDPVEKIPVIKQFEEDEMVAIEPLFSGPLEIDGHGDTMDEVEIRKMVDNLNKAVSENRLKSKLFHKEETKGFTVIKAWVNECPCIIGETEVPEGQPIVKTKFNDKKLWELRKSGKLKGVSIGAKAGSYEEIEL